SCSETTAPNGIDTSIAGRIDTPAMNRPWRVNSRTWNGRLNVNRTTSAPRATSLPVDSSAPRPGNETVERCVTEGLPGPAAAAVRGPAGTATTDSPGCAPPARAAAARAARPAGHRRVPAAAGGA